MGTASGANTNGFGDVAVGNKTNGGGAVRGINAGNKANGVSDAVGVGADDTTNGGVGRDAASFVPKTILPSRWQERFAFLGVHVKAPMRSAVRAKSYLSSPTPKNLSRIRFLRMFYCTRAKIP